MELLSLTLNCWGLPWKLSKDRPKRMQCIAEQLASGSYDIVALQEVWVTSDYELIRERVQAVLPYSYYFYRGCVNTGLCLFSKWPITDTLCHPYTLNGYAHELLQMDWYASKMVALCRLDIDGTRVNVYNTHVHALYARSDQPGLDRVRGHRLAQHYELSEFVRQTSSSSGGGADLVLLLGDLNTEPASLGLRLLAANAGLRDAWETRENTEYRNGATNERLDNRYACSQTLYYANTEDGERIDYILYRSSPGAGHVRCLRTTLDLRRVGQSDYHYSDHEGIVSHFKITSDKAASAGGDSVMCNHGNGSLDNDGKEELVHLLDEASTMIQEAQGETEQGIRWSVVKATACLLFLLASVWVGPCCHANGPALLAWHCLGALLAAFYACRALVVGRGEWHSLEGIRRGVALRRSRVEGKAGRF